MRNLLLITTVLFLSTTHGHNSCPKRVQLPINLCPETVKPNSKYRPIDGKLNNRCLNSGQSFKPYDRLKSAAYDDCLWKFRKTAVSGQELPPPRYITNGIVREFTRTVQCHQTLKRQIFSRSCLASSLPMTSDHLWRPCHLPLAAVPLEV